MKYLEALELKLGVWSAEDYRRAAESQTVNRAGIVGVIVSEYAEKGKPVADSVAAMIATLIEAYIQMMRAARPDDSEGGAT